MAESVTTVQVRTAALLEGLQRVTQTKLLHGLFP